MQSLLYKIKVFSILFINNLHISKKSSIFAYLFKEDINTIKFNSQK